MSRGDADNPRRRDVRIRLTDDEWSAWNAARERSGRKEMGAWARAVIHELVLGTVEDRRPGDLPRVVVPEVNRDAVEQLRRVGNNLNQLAHAANADGRMDDVVDELRRVLLQVDDALREVRGQRPARVVTPPPPSADGVAEHPESAGAGEAALVDESPVSAADRAAAILARVRGRQDGGPDAAPRRRWFAGGRS